MNPVAPHRQSPTIVSWKRIDYLLLTVFMLLSSCIHDEPELCTTLQVQLNVKDKNYFNINNTSLEVPKSEFLSFREYIPTLYYSLRDVDSGAIVEEQGIFNITSNASVLPIAFCECLPYGKYTLTVWGGLPDKSSLTDNSLTDMIHTNGTEGSDIYLAHDTLLYDSQHTNYTFDMKRVTGKLIVQVNHLPTSIRYASKTISNLYGQVNQRFNYRMPVTVNKIEVLVPAEEIVMRTILAPSTGELQSLLHLDFYNTSPPATPIHTPKDAYITVRRNELTILKYVYDDEKQDFSIYLLLNDKWETIHDLNIN